MEQFILSVNSKQGEENKVTRRNQHGFNKVKLCFTTLIAFSDVMIRWVVERRTVAAFHLDLRNVFDTVSQNILVNKLRMCGIDEKTVMCFKSCLTDRVQSGVLSGTQFSWKLVASIVPHGSLLILFDNFTNDLGKG